MEKLTLTKDQYRAKTSGAGDLSLDEFLSKNAIKIPYFYSEGGLLTIQSNRGANFLMLSDGILYIPAEPVMNYHRQLTEFSEKDYKVLHHAKRKIEARLQFIDDLEKKMGSLSMDEFKSYRYKNLEEIIVSDMFFFI